MKIDSLHGSLFSAWASVSICMVGFSRSGSVVTAQSGVRIAALGFGVFGMLKGPAL